MVVTVILLFPWSLVGVVALMVLFVRPKVAELWSDPAVLHDWRLVTIPATVAFAIGFFVPTWYRANLLRMRMARADAQPASAGRIATPSSASAGHRMWTEEPSTLGPKVGPMFQNEKG